MQVSRHCPERCADTRSATRLRDGFERRGRAWDTRLWLLSQMSARSSVVDPAGSDPAGLSAWPRNATGSATLGTPAMPRPLGDLNVRSCSARRRGRLGHAPRSGSAFRVAVRCMRTRLVLQDSESCRVTAGSANQRWRRLDVQTMCGGPAPPALLVCQKSCQVAQRTVDLQSSDHTRLRSRGDWPCFAVIKMLVVSYRP